jgi:CubicO group peptidase (beta-lactamase class C family)
MLSRFAIGIATLILFHAADSAAQTTPLAAAADQSLAARIDVAIGPFYKPGEPGAAILVVKDGKAVFRKAYGMADVAKLIPMTPDMSMRLGSLTKQFTAAAIMLLADAGKLSVTDDITRYLPDYPTHGRKITIEHLLTHTSGIVNFLAKPEHRAIATKDLTQAQMIDFFKNDPLDFEPGANVRYNNSAYFLLGVIIEKVSGMTYARFVERYIFVPLGMDNTAYEGYERGSAARAAGHARVGAAFGPSMPISMSHPYSAGAVVSTVDDMARWDAAISSGQLLKAASWQRALTPFRLSSGAPNFYGYAFGIHIFKGSPMIFNIGGIDGFRAASLRLPDEKVYVAVLSNAGGFTVGPGVVARKAAAIAIGQPYREFTPIVLERKVLADFAGEYGTGGEASRAFRIENSQLVMQSAGNRFPAVLQPYSERGFFDPNSLDYMEFSRDASGKVVRLTYYQDDKESVHEKIR